MRSSQTDHRVWVPLIEAVPHARRDINYIASLLGNRHKRIDTADGQLLVDIEGLMNIHTLISIDEERSRLENRPTFEEQLSLVKRSVSTHLKKMVASGQQWRCKLCGKTLPAEYEVDHVVPLFRGGRNSKDNLQALCRNCHGRKSALDLQQHELDTGTATIRQL